MADSGSLHTIKRLGELWWVHGKMDALWMARDLTALLSFLISDLIGAAATVTATMLLAARFGGIGRWTTAEMGFMLGYALLVNGLPFILCNYNVAYVSRRIGRGQLDHTLLQPQPLALALLTEGFAPVSAVMGLVPGLALLGWALSHGAHPVVPAWPLAFLLNLAASTLIVLSVSFVWGSLAFWAPRGAEELNMVTWTLLDNLAPFPLDGLAGGLAAGLLTAVPTGFIAWYPSRALLGLDRTPYATAVTPLAAVAFAATATMVFKKGLAHYARTGSGRYSAGGHRR
jgi:ABC-2 type transport system permease protein